MALWLNTRGWKPKCLGIKDTLRLSYTFAHGKKNESAQIPFPNAVFVLILAFFFYFPLWHIALETKSLLVRVLHSPIPLWNKAVFPKSINCVWCSYLHPRTVCIMKYATGWKSYLPVTPQTNSKDSWQNWWANIYYQRPTTIYSRKLGSNSKTSAKSNQTCLWSLASVVTDVTQRSSTSVVWQLKKRTSGKTIVP